MADHDEAPDPLDGLYRDAEAELSDEAGRGRRRARVLGALEHEDRTGDLAPRRRAVSRPEGWLAAAALAGLGFFFVSQVRMPELGVSKNRGSAPPTPFAGEPARQTLVKPAPKASLNKPPQEANRELADEKPTEPIGPVEASPVLPAERSKPSFASKAEASNERSAPQVLAAPLPALPPPIAMPAPPPAPAAGFIAPVTAAKRASVMSAAPASGEGAKLRTAAELGLVSEVETFLDQGGAVDAPDRYGQTALMLSIKAGHRDTAALLVRRGANLDRRDQSGLSAREMVKAKDDPAFEKALGLSPEGAP